MTTVIRLWKTSQGHGQDTNIGDLLVREGLAASVSSSDYLNGTNHTLESVAASSLLTVEIDRGSHVENISCSFGTEDEALQKEEAVTKNVMAHVEASSGPAEHLDAHTGNPTHTQGNWSGKSSPNQECSKHFRSHHVRLY